MAPPGVSRLPNHVAATACLGNCGDDEDDYAPEQGLLQSFPVVAPLSDKQLGPQDVVTPSDVWSQIRDKELTDDHWRFKRERAQASIAHEQGLAIKLRHRAEQAEREAEAAAAHARAQVIDVERAVEERRRKAGESVRQMRMRLQEAQKLRDEAAQSCRERIGEAKALLANEQKHTAEVEELLQRRRESSAAAWRQNEELEAQSAARVAAVEKEAELCEQESNQHVEEAKQKVKEQVAQAKLRSQEELRAARDRLSACEESCRYRLEVEAQRKEQCDEELQKRKTEAAARLEIDQFIMQRHLSNLKEDCAAHVQQIAKRELATQLDVERKVKVLTDVFSSTASRSLQTHERERQFVKSVGQAVYTLGDHASNRQQYNVRIDEQLSACLDGHLHGVAGIATPSPRALPPPVL
jgi:hypothetical protein